MRVPRRISCCQLLVLVPVVLSAFVSLPALGSDTAQRAAEQALRLLHTPYRYGGTHPSSGFDCSGLVQFSYERAGFSVPRTTTEQRRATVPIRLAHLRPGDLIFFDQEGKKNSHVAIYLGQGRFIHAPSSGKRVRTDALASTYWRRHISEARRIDG